MGCLYHVMSRKITHGHPRSTQTSSFAAEGVFAPEMVEVGSDEDSGLSAGSGLSWFTMGQKTGSSSLACLFHVQRRRIHHMHPVPAPGQWRGIGTGAPPPSSGGRAVEAAAVPQQPHRPDELQRRPATGGRRERSWPVPW